MASKELAKTESGPSLIAWGSVDEIRDLFRTNLGAGGMSQADLERIKIPAGGATSWEISTLSGTDSVKELQGVVVYSRYVRSYWAQKYGAGESGPPQCSSANSLIGIGSPGGSCLECPLAKFGTAVAENGQPSNAQACRQSLQLFLLRPGSLLPDVVSISPASLKPARAFLMKLTAAQIKLPEALLRIGLSKEKSASGVVYSQAVFAMVRKLDDAEANHMRAYAEMLRPMLERVAVNEDPPAAGGTEAAA